MGEICRSILKLKQICIFSNRMKKELTHKGRRRQIQKFAQKNRLIGSIPLKSLKKKFTFMPRNFCYVQTSTRSRFKDPSTLAALSGQSYRSIFQIKSVVMKHKTSNVSLARNMKKSGIQNLSCYFQIANFLINSSIIKSLSFKSLDLFITNFLPLIEQLTIL